MSHEYAVLGGLNRALIGKLVMWVSVVLSGAVSAVAGLAVAIIGKVGFSIPPVVLWPITAGLIYGGLYWLFEGHVWKLPRLSALLRVPNLSGTWTCRGQSINQTDRTLGPEWEAEVLIEQSWDKIRIRWKTSRSTSISTSAALIYEGADGYRVLYSYRNQPNICESDLAPHRGYAELAFPLDVQSASGEYFNGHGRYTYGTLNLTRSESKAP